MEQKQLLNLGLDGERHHVVHTAVPPTDMLFVFGAIILRVKNHHVGTPDKLHHFGFLTAGVFQGGIVARRMGDAIFVVTTMRLVVGEKTITPSPV